MGAAGGRCTEKSLPTKCVYVCEVQYKDICLEIVIQYENTIARYHFPNEAFERVTENTKDAVVGFAKRFFLSAYPDEHSGT